MKTKIIGFFISIISILEIGCFNPPPGITPVTGFELNRYLGVWYEIARLDHSFERGTNQVTAEYSLNTDGSVQVKNRGYLTATQKWDEAIGRAEFVGESNIGHLKVSFFQPFYGAYVIYELDKVDYQYAFVTGSDKTFLWFLSRTPTVSADLLNRFVSDAKIMGYPTESLIFVQQ